MDPFRLGELYQKIEKNEIPGIPSDFKLPVQETLVKFGVEVVKKKRYWCNKHPVDLIDEINEAILVTITTGVDFDETPLSPEELDHTKKLRIVFYHIRHVVREILRQEENQGS